MTIRLPKKTLIDRILKRFGYHRHIQLPEDYQELRDRFGPYVQVKAKYSTDSDNDNFDILAELSILADKLVTVAAAIQGLEELSDNDREAATYGLSRMVIELSNQVSDIHAAYEMQGWNRDDE